MGVFNGNSIYNYGAVGGGGGIVDGGELDLRDYIILENNKKYTLDNDSLSVLNFICEKADDEQFDIVVDLTAETNCQINVFGKNGNLLYSMPFSGTNVISTNGTYKITILNGSYFIEQLTVPSVDPSGIFLDDVFYGLVKINGLLWSTSDLLLNIGDNIYTNESPFGEKRYFRGDSNDLSAALNDYGVRLPTKDEVDSLIAYLGSRNIACAAIRSTTQWNSGRNGNNSSGLSVQPSGYFNYIGGAIFDKGYFGSLLASGNQSSNIYRFYYDDSIVGYSTSITNSPVRFVIDT